MSEEQPGIPDVDQLARSMLLPTSQFPFTVTPSKNPLLTINGSALLAEIVPP